MKFGQGFCCLILVVTSQAYVYDPAWEQYNLNQNKTAVDPLDYWGEWSDHSFTPSPSNWRFPFYTLFLDRFVNGDPTNDNINGTSFEHDINSNQIRHGGDLEGLMDTLDYLEGMGIKGLYIAGSPFVNQPWGYDQYSPIDLTLLDQHFGTIETWRKAIDAIHARGMYVVLDNTFGTMGDLIGFEGYLNVTAPFTLQEHHVQWKSDRIYHDFHVSNTYNTTCEYPRFWLETGYPVGEDVTSQMVGCYDSDFDQYGDTEAFGVYPDWRRELSKFASVQDRLRDWHTPVREKLENFYCIMIAQLDIDGYRYDKATQSTVDALGFMNGAMRKCAKRFGKANFFLPGEITGGNVFGSIFLGRGRQPDMRSLDLKSAVTMSNASDDKYFIREPEAAALDSAAFHYTVYRTLTRFLGMDGNLAAGYDSPLNWVDMWNDFLLTNDFVNPNTGEFDPRHMYGVTNQDVFRWPSITNGIHRQLLGHFITTVTMPGMPLLLWGEEQSFYVLDNTATNYIFGRQPMSSATAWMTHGCYSFPVPSTQFYQMPVEAARHGCEDANIALDHRDPAHPIRNILKHMFHLRNEFPVLNDGFFLQQLSNQTFDVFMPGSDDVATETGIWSVMRSEFPEVQNLSTAGGAGNQPIWLIYSNLNATREYQFDCGDNDTALNTTALIAPFDSGVTVRNLFYPFDEQTLEDGPRSLGIGGSTKRSGCLQKLNMEAYGFGAYVPSEKWLQTKPMVTKFTPGHDARFVTRVAPNDTEPVFVELHFSDEMDCDSVTDSISFASTNELGLVPILDRSSVNCALLQDAQVPPYVGAVPGVWSWNATVNQVPHGVHQMTVDRPTNKLSSDSTNATDHFLFRTGFLNNPIVFPLAANYSSTLLSKDAQEGLTLNHAAAGADKWRYSTNWGTSFSAWMDYTGGSTPIERQPWSGTDKQKWEGDHVRVEYFTRRGGSSDHVQEADSDSSTLSRRFPHLFLNGPYNQYGYDEGLDNEMKLTKQFTWQHDFVAEWRKDGTLAQINVWGINPDGHPDQSMVFGDADGDSVLDRLPPSSLSTVVLNITDAPIKPYLGWRIVIDDGSLRFHVVPVGSMWNQVVLFVLLLIVPILTGTLAVVAFRTSFYQVKFNKVGVSEKGSYVPMVIKKPFYKYLIDKMDKIIANQLEAERVKRIQRGPKFQKLFGILSSVRRRKRTILIATMEYDIEDWAIKVKIGGLGVMAQLMGKNLEHQNLIWVVPCCGGIDYPKDKSAEPMTVTILGNQYEIQVQYHVLRNITYVLLDAPVFRQQTKAEPYPARMDDMTSAIYYSAWNQCIAQTMDRFRIDLYHINDYHGAVAPLYMLPRTIPVCLSLHNAEFQGLWPMRTKKEVTEVCSVFNLPVKVAQQYVQFGEVFNLLHAGASYLRIHQDGFGAVGVSKKYGKRAWARYPIFWGLKKVGQLPNPDPSDTAEWDKKLPKESDITIDAEYEASRGELRRQAQEWAGLEQDPEAELFVFVGRWSMQKGIDLIADIFPSILENHSNVQLITIGPVIDLYGKFAAAKLDQMMKVWPGRVCSKPVFTALPPFIFSGAEFALIPSRDEPFGLVAVEFGRKGALGVGARVGGLGQMPGWWYTVESTSTAHLLHQFKIAIEESLSSKANVRAMMRARSAKQRFPVAQWVEDLEILQTTSIRLHRKANETTNAITAPDNALSKQGDDAGRKKPELLRPHSYAARHHNSSTGHEDYSRTHRSMLAMSHSANQDAQVGQAISIYNPLEANPLDLPSLIDRPGASLHGSTPVNGSQHSQTASVSSNSSPNQHRRHQSGAKSLAVANSAGSRFSNEELEEQIALPEQVFSRPDGPSASTSLLSIDTVVGDKTDYKLQQVDPFFTDSTGFFYEQFKKKLESLNGSNSEDSTCIEEYLVRSEKKWFADFRDAKLGRLPVPSGVRTPKHRSSFHIEEPVLAPSTREGSTRVPSSANSFVDTDTDSDPFAEFLLGKDYKPPIGLANWMQIRIGDWPIYSFFMAFGQIVAANSYQITLLTGQVGQPAAKLYAVASIYLVTSIMWWILYRRFISKLSLSLPFFFYGLAFIFIGTAHFAPSMNSRGWLQNVASGLYAVASSSGSIFFSLNFGDDGGAPVKAWVFRACVIQGTQQLYVVVLWYWGSIINKASIAGFASYNSTFANSWKITAVCIPIALLFWVIGLVMWFGLPKYYRQRPGALPGFYKSIGRRNIVLWFFVTVIIQNFFLSAPYGRNWSYLFNTSYATDWQIFMLVIAFFVGVWALLLWLFGYLSKSHTWILPMFAIGLGAPRWAQIWWGTSNIGLWLPWTGSHLASGLVSRSLWLWLGVLDSLQGVGLGMMLLGTLTRVHVCFTLIAAQVLGSVATIVARAVAPNRIGPGPISPDITGGLGTIWQAWFWVGLICNLAICVGYFKFYRKEQLTKP